MALDERYEHVIDEDAGVEDVMGRARVVAVGRDRGRVILAIAFLDRQGEPTVDTRAWVDMPNGVAEQLGYHLHSAQEKNRQEGRGV